MNRSFLYKAIILPSAMGIMLCIISFFAVNFTDAYIPIRQNTQFSYHNAEPVQVKSAEKVCENANIGSIEFGTSRLSVIYESDYSNLLGGVSFLGESSKNGSGCIYLKTISTNARDMAKAGSVTLNTVFSSGRYTLAERFESDSEYKILTSSPAYPGCIVMYYQKSDGVGLSSSYEVMVFEEVG